MTEDPKNIDTPSIWQRVILLANSRVWWLAPLLLTISILLLGWVVLQALKYTTPFVYEAF